MNQGSKTGLTVTTPGDLEIVMTRTFEAPREKVFRAHSSCEHVSRWWGRGNPLDCEMDFRPGGSWRFVEHADGQLYGFRGDYLEIEAPARIVQTFEYDGTPGHIVLDSTVFEEHDGRTTVTTTSRFDSIEDRDGMLAAGMTDGAAQSMDALEAYLTTIS